MVSQKSGLHKQFKELVQKLHTATLLLARWNMQPKAQGS